MTDPFPTLKQLRYFVALAQSGQYRKAAERLGLTQPSLSQQIIALEAQLGLTLFERGRRGAVLTVAGREVMDQAQAVLDQVERLMGLSKEVAVGVSGTVRLGSTPTIGPYVLPRLLQHLHAAHPDLKLVARDAPPRDLVEELVGGMHDLILTQLPVHAKDLVAQPLYREPLFLAVAGDHPLAGRDQVRASELAGQDMLSLGAAYAQRATVERLCAESGARPRDDYEGTSLDALRQMVAMNMGVALLPALYVRSEVREGEADVALLRLKGGLSRTVGFVWRRATGKPAALRRFREVADMIVRRDFADDVSALGDQPATEAR